MKTFWKVNYKLTETARDRNMVLSSKEIKAARILAKLYLMRRMDFNEISVRDITEKATAEDIDYYYYWLFTAFGKEC